MVIGTAVALIHVAVPNPVTCALPIETSVLSDTDQITLVRLDCVIAQPAGTEANAKNCCEFTGVAECNQRTPLDGLYWREPTLQH